MAAAPQELLVGLRDELGLRRAVETGTYRGGGARLLAGVFEDVVTIELSEELHRQAVAELTDVTNVELLRGDSAAVLPGVVAPSIPSLYFLDGHWSGGRTAGRCHECPVLSELDALRAGHADDCVIIDDARLFAAPPPPPHEPAHWPTLVEVFEALLAVRPGHHVTLLADQVIGVPQRARPIVDSYGQRLHVAEPAPATRGRLAGLARRARHVAGRAKR